MGYSHIKEQNSFNLNFTSNTSFKQLEDFISHPLCCEEVWISHFTKAPTIERKDLETIGLL